MSGTWGTPKQEPTCSHCGNASGRTNYLFANKSGTSFICDDCVTTLFTRLDRMNALVMCDHSNMTRQ